MFNMFMCSELQVGSAYVEVEERQEDTRNNV